MGGGLGSGYHFGQTSCSTATFGFLSLAGCSELLKRLVHIWLPHPFYWPEGDHGCSNLKPDKERLDVLAAKLQKEFVADRITGPFSTPPLLNLRASPLGVVPKKAPGVHRLIYHLSYPWGSSVKDLIPPEICYREYASFDHAVGLVRACGVGTLMAKCKFDGA